MNALIEQYGEWTYDIPLSDGVWTRGNEGVPHTRLKRIVQITADLLNNPLSDCRILDLGALDGLFSIEFAHHGAQVIGLEARRANLEKAQFCKDVLKLDNLQFVLDDARNISLEKYGTFDVIVCSGLLYHLPGNDALRLIEQMYAMTTRALIIDTHISLNPVVSLRDDGRDYFGEIYREHRDDTTQEEKERRLLASIDNPTSFWFSRPSLINRLQAAGFTSVYECFAPPHLNFGKSGLESDSRCTFVAIKAANVQLVTSPEANVLQENFPEGSLSYSPRPTFIDFIRYYSSTIARFGSRVVARIR